MDFTKFRIKIYIEEQYQLPPKLQKRALKKHRRIYEYYKYKIQELRELGLTKELDDAVVTFGISAMMNWAYRWFRDDGRLSIE